MRSATVNDRFVNMSWPENKYARFAH